MEHAEKTLTFLCEAYLVLGEPSISISIISFLLVRQINRTSDIYQWSKKEYDDSVVVRDDNYFNLLHSDLESVNKP